MTRINGITKVFEIVPNPTAIKARIVKIIERVKAMRWPLYPCFFANFYPTIPKRYTIVKINTHTKSTKCQYKLAT